MKNLVVQTDAAASLFEGGPAGERPSACCMCLNASEGKMYVATGTDVRCVPISKPNEVEWLERLAEYGSGRVVSMCFVVELEALCIGLSSGELLLLRCNNEGGVDEVEEVGGIEGGLCALEWSPDGEVFAAISGAGRLLVMNLEWELLFESSLPGVESADGDGCPPDLMTDAQISWRGDAKFFATSTRVVIGSQPASITPPRGIHVWDRSEGVVHSKAEGANLYSPVLAWQPNGRHLYTAAPTGAMRAEGPDVEAAAATATGAAAVAAAAVAAAAATAAASTAPSPPRVILFECNGLQHGGFDLPPSSLSGDVAAMSWSCDSELLALLLAPCTPISGDDEGSKCWTMQVWHRSNWHWYLKQERCYPALPSPSPSTDSSSNTLGSAPLVRWDEQHNSRLHVLSRNGRYESLTFCWSMCVSAHGTAAVVDGACLLLTPMRHGVVPPPMSPARALFPAPLVAITLGWAPLDGVPAVAGSIGVLEDGDELIAGVMSDGRLAVLRSVECDLWEETMQEQMEVSGEVGGLQAWIPDLGGVPLASGRHVRAISWLSSTRLLVLASPLPDGLEEQSANDVLLEVQLTWPQEGDEGSGGSAEEGPPLLIGCSFGGKQHKGQRVLSIASAPPGSTACTAIVQLTNGQLLHYIPSATLSAPGTTYPLSGTFASFPQACTSMWALPDDGSTTSTTNGVAVSDLQSAVGLTPSGQLYWGTTLVAGEVTSAAVRCGGAGGTALLYTTRRSLLYTVFVSQLQGGHQHKELVAGLDEQNSHKRKQKKGDQREGELSSAMHMAMKPLACNAAARDVMVRAVEQGSHLVSVPYAGVDVVLQMPRGNLEGVAPRALVLAHIVVALSQLDYGRAWELATKHRVDLNLIVDYNWPSFLDQAPRFVEAVAKPSDLCDLIFALLPGSVLAPGGLYGNVIVVPAGVPPMEAKSGLPDGDTTEKVDAVCSVLRSAVEAVPGGSSMFLNVVVTSYARSDPPQLEAALACIRDAKELALLGKDPSACQPGASEAPSAPTLSLSSAYVEPAAPSTPGTTPSGGGQLVGNAERALKHLLLTVDPDDLYRAALSLYNLPLAYMVVVNAQKDPGEYMIELQGFAAVTDDKLRHHRIDMHLQRYGRALDSLVQAGHQHFDEALKLARKHNLLRQLLELYQDDTDRAARVLDACGDSLAAASKHEDAGAAYAGAGQIEKALAAYRSASVWRMVFVMARRLQYSSTAMQELAAEVADDLVFGGQVSAAANVHLLYLQDVDTAVSFFAKAREWREAQRCAYQHDRADLVDTVLAPAAAEASASLLSDTREAAERVTKYWARLKEVRGKRVAMAAAVEAATEDGGLAELEVDAMSDSGSMISGLSMYTDNTHTGQTVAGSSSRAPSTVGGKKAHKPKDRSKGKSKGNKIRQGSPGEEKSLIELVHGQAPTPSVLEEASQLMELLVILGHLPDARTLQQQLSNLIQLHQDAVRDIEQHAAEQASVAASEGRTSNKPAAPAVNPPKEVAWKLDILRPV